ncbi:MAG: 2-C-methyl-D-erythritol 4-phosphate cytidylyltransferase [Actinobacteria bacterium RBG_19FT_COMBO_36_27]|nr:MAG: 2-C-methyl-D-erythritol 4-phosphate cytidylyltransferase [Actinobacteria bacterium RBG_19FT_COMBO_36_27]
MNAAIITAAGRGTRFKGNISKQFMDIYGKPILAHTISTFQNSSKIKEIYISIPGDYIELCQKNIINKYSFSKVKKLVVGGSSRQESVYNALKEIPSSTKLVSIHDGVRPLVTPEEINLLINVLLRENKKDCKIRGVIMAAPVMETVKVTDGNIINKTIPRDTVWHAQTPQTFFYEDILKAHNKALEDGFIGTDDASLMERMSLKVYVVRGRRENIKITTPLDLFLAELIMIRNGRK